MRGETSIATPITTFPPEWSKFTPPMGWWVDVAAKHCLKMGPLRTGRIANDLWHLPDVAEADELGLQVLRNIVVASGEYVGARSAQLLTLP